MKKPQTPHPILDAICADLGSISDSELARRAGLHRTIMPDIRSGKRRMTLQIAKRLDAATPIKRAVLAVVEAE